MTVYDEPFPGAAKLKDEGRSAKNPEARAYLKCCYWILFDAAMWESKGSSDEQREELKIIRDKIIPLLRFRAEQAEKPW
jgi:hypothetical protein